MAKQKKDRHRKAESTPVKANPRLTQKQQGALSVGIMTLLILGYFFPIAFEGKTPPASDTLAWQGAVHSIDEARAKSGGIPLWANNLFAGMPSYMISLRAPFKQPARWLVDLVSKMVDWRVVYYLIGSAGMFLLMRFFGTSMFASLLASLSFAWWPYLIGLVEAGHNSKLRTIMLAPFILLTFVHLMRSPRLLNTALFAIAFSAGMLANHYQIMFYLILSLFAFGVMYLIPLLREKQWSGIAKRIGLAGAAVTLAIGTAAFPTRLVLDYSKYSIRGGTGEQGSGGLSFDYATSWSFYPGEMITLLIPRFYGGSSAERYEGDAAPELKGQTIPGYWGPMPFTASTHYLGVVTLFFVTLALLFRWRERLVMTLATIAVVALLLSFGKHFSLLYHAFFNFVPFFDKFRVPSMILVLFNWMVAILAGLGFEHVLAQTDDAGRQKLWRGTLMVFGLFLIVGFVPFLFKNWLSLVRPEDLQRFKPHVLELLKAARYDLMKQDAIRMLLFLFATAGLIVAHIRAHLPKSIFAVAIIALLLIDLFSVDQRFMKTLVKSNELDQHFAETETDRFLSQDTTLYRILPLGKLYGDNRWSYRNQSLGGYHPAKLRTIQDINESCLYKGTAPGFGNPGNLPLNWNVLRMFNVKYLLLNGTVEHQNLTQAYVDRPNGIVVYRLDHSLPRLFPVGKAQVVPDRTKRFARLNDPDFDPGQTAIVEKPLSADIAMPDTFTADITDYEPNRITAMVSSDKQTLLVLSEMYYPAGWSATIDGNLTAIYKTDHALRAILLPAGRHEVDFKLKPKEYTASLWVKGGSVLTIYLMLGVALLPYARRFVEQARAHI